MTTGSIYRDVASSEGQSPCTAREGRAYVAVIGIDRYRTWDRLYNAVSDAKGALKLFAGLGFELVAPALFDESATGDALRRLVVDDLSGLGKSDSLVLFFAGHGHTVARTYGGASVRDGYLIPADGDRPGGRATTWIRLESWITEITRIPAKHILVILDACHSGLALGPILQWRSRGMENVRREPLEQLRARRSRRIITSALDDQLAMDGGPVPGHSLFTGCLIEAMTGGLVASTGHQIVTGSEIGHYVQRRVSEYPRSAQTPDFGALELDDRGELLVHLRSEGARGTQAAPEKPTIEGAGLGNEPCAPGSVQPSDPIAVVAIHASELPNSGELRSATWRRALYWRMGGSMVIVAVAVTAALLAMRNSASLEGPRSLSGVPSDARSAVVMPADASIAVAPDAVALDATDASVTSETGKADKKNPPQPSRRNDVKQPQPDRPSPDDRTN
ncbi:MAG TPA: caspase family protein [Kofleriaceae bacterium]|jgi:uncharacterized caspase-like protein|nr:caspase family protein [Kofleriaceae bacterium]